jgi:hypothetical protein
MGDDDWSRSVRCCLWKERKRAGDPDFSHALCWGQATAVTGSLPVPKLAACISACTVKTNHCAADPAEP